MFTIIVNAVDPYRGITSILDNKLFKTKEDATKYLFNYIKHNDDIYMNFDMIQFMFNIDDLHYINIDKEYLDYQNYIKNIVDNYEKLYDNEIINKIHESLYENDSDFNNEKIVMLEEMLYNNDPDKFKEEYVNITDETSYLEMYQKSQGIKDSLLAKEFLYNNVNFITQSLSNKELENFNWNYIKPLFIKGNKITIPKFSSVMEFTLIEVNY